MGVTKTQEFTDRENKIAEYAKAFAHPARVAILQYLLKEKTCICGDLVEFLPLSQSTVSQHLKELKRIGIIKGEIDPPKVCYCINEEIWEDMQNTFGKLLQVSLKDICC